MNSSVNTCTKTDLTQPLHLHRLEAATWGGRGTQRSTTIRHPQYNINDDVQASKGALLIMHHDCGLWLRSRQQMTSFRYKIAGTEIVWSSMTSQ